MGQEKTQARDAARFGLGLAVLLMFLTVFCGWRGHVAAATASGTAALLVVALPYLARDFWLVCFRAAMRVSEAMSRAIAIVILAVLFALVVTPTALVLRALGRRPLDLLRRDGRTTFWVTRTDERHSLDRYRRLF